MVISTEESKKTYHKFTFRAKATSLSKKLDILRKERNVNMPEQRNKQNILVQLLGTGIWTDLDDQMSQTEDTHFSILLALPKWPISIPAFFLFFRQFWDQGAAWSLSNSTGLEDTRKGVASPESKKLPTSPSKEYPDYCPIANLGVILEVNRESSLRGYPLGVPPFCHHPSGFTSV